MIPGGVSRKAAAIVAVVVLCAIGAPALTRTTHGFIAYYGAARLLTGGGFSSDVYSDAWFQRYVQRLSGTPVREIYGPNLPTMTLLATPVSWLPHDGARTVWIVLSIALFAWAIEAAAGRTARSTAMSVGLIALACFSPPVFANIATGQAYLAIAALVTAAVLALQDGRDPLAGAFIGIAVITKTAGLPLILMLAVARRWRALAVAAAVCGVAVAIVLVAGGVSPWLAYPTYVRAFLDRPQSTITAYQTVRSWTGRMTGSLSAATAVGMSAGALATVVTLVRLRHEAIEVFAAGAICAGLVLTPIAEDHHFVLLAFPLVLALATGRARWLTWSAALLFLVPAAWTIRRFAASYPALGYPRLYATVALWAFWTITRSRAPEPDRSSSRAAPGRSSRSGSPASAWR